MKSNINVDTKTFIRFWLVVIAFSGVIWLLIKAIPALIILGISFFLALVLNSPVSLIAKKLPNTSRAGATAIAYLIVITILIAMLILVVPPIIEQTAKFIQAVLNTAVSAINQWQSASDLIAKYNLQNQVNTALSSIERGAALWTTNISQNILGAIGSLFELITGFILVVVLTFLMLVEGPSLKSRLLMLYTNKSRRHKIETVLDKMYHVVNGFITGQFIVSGISAITAGLSVFSLSLIFNEVPTSLALPAIAITFVLSLIPLFGATIVGILITASIAFNHIPAAIIYLIYFIIYQQVENNVIQPRIQAKMISLSALTVLVSVTLGLYTFGIIGGLVAIPIAGCIRVLIEEYFANRIKSD